jgi:hypothetical protein
LPLVTGHSPLVLMDEIPFAKLHALGNDFIVSSGADVGITRRGANPSSTGR